MDEFFDKVKSAVTNATKTVSQKSGEVVSYVKQKNTLANLENEIEKNFVHMGEFVYRTSKQEGTAFEGELATFCRKNDELFEKVEEIKLEIATLRKQKLCPNCNYECTITDNFCPGCGNKFYE